MVKVPPARVSQPITRLRLRVLGASLTSPRSLIVRRGRVLQYVHGKILVRHAPTPQVPTEAAPPVTGATTPRISATLAVGS